MISFVVYGTPQPQGSTRAFMPKGAKHPVVTSDNSKLKPWRQQVSICALAAMREAKATMWDRKTPIRLCASFYFRKPASTPKKVLHKTTKPDVDKILRSLADSLTGVVFTDDSQVVECRIDKQFGTPERVEVLVSALEVGNGR